jgi:hypothetical protein
LIVDIADSAIKIHEGRVWLVTDGFERDGRLIYAEGLNVAISSFALAQLAASSDLEMLIVAEYMFLSQELKHCDSSETQTISSLTQAIQSFDDALLSLQAVEMEHLYKVVDMAYPHNAKHRLKDMPKDAFHIACAAHRTRIGNILRTPGLNLTERTLLQQRAANLTTAQSVYLDKQKQALTSSQKSS